MRRCLQQLKTALVLLVPLSHLATRSVEQSLKIIDTLIEAGADALSWAFPFSGPMADGPTI